MTATFSQQFTADPGNAVYWVYGFTTVTRRVGVEIVDDVGAEYRYRGYLSTFVSAAGVGKQIFPELAFAPVWTRRMVYILPRDLQTNSLLFRCSKRAGGILQIIMFVDDAIN